MVLGRTVRILSVDGGGVRGLIPALLLKELEKRLSRHGNSRPFSSLFDLMAGTSAGGLIVLGLACPGENRGRSPLPRFSPADLVSFYRDRGAEIFPFKRFNSLRLVSQAFGEKYDAQGYQALLDETFGQRSLKDCLTPLLITAYDINRGMPYFFKYRRGRRGREDLNFRLADVARATSAAPTYFEPADIRSLGPECRRFCLVDGSLVANNPALCAYTEARKLFPGARRFVIVSLGTGVSPRRYTYEDVRHWGYLDWVNPAKDVPLISELSRGHSVSVDHMLFRTPRVRYHRLEVPLSRGIDMDDARPSSADLLTEAVNHYIEEAQDLLEAVARDLGPW